MPVRGCSFCPSPLPGGAASDRVERARRQVRLEARDAARPDERVVARPGRQLETIAGRELDGPIRIDQPEPDRTALDDDDLVVVVVMGP